MWKQMGLQAFGLNRIDWRLKNDMDSSKSLEFFWQSSASLEDRMWIHVMPDHYCTPGECGYDGNLIIDTDSELVTYQLNAIQQGEAFVRMAAQRASQLRHNNVLIPFGCDFAHQNAFRSFEQMDQLIAYVNGNRTLNATVQYAFFSDYARAAQASGAAFPVRTPADSDFFPYASGPYAYWTGYYTSRPASKGFIRSRGQVLRTAEALLATVTPTAVRANVARLHSLRRAVGVTQHHDAISGTEKQHVADDYGVQLSQGTADASAAAAAMLELKLRNANVTTTVASAADDTPAFEALAGGVLPNVADNTLLPVVVHNSLGWPRREFVNFSSTQNNLVVYDANGTMVPAQNNPTQPGTLERSTANYTLWVLVDLPPMGARVYFVQANSTAAVRGAATARPAAAWMANDVYNVTLGTDGRLAAVQHRVHPSASVALRHEYVQYVSAAQGVGQSSGAYVFRAQPSGVYSIGSDNSNNAAMFEYDFVAGFDRDMSSMALAFATPVAASNYADTFAVTLDAATNADRLCALVDRADAGFPPNDHWGVREEQKKKKKGKRINKEVKTTTRKE